jgi:RHS repeat-associated protein
MSDSSGATAWTYDPMGQVLTESRKIVGSTNITKSVGYTYNLDGSPATLTYPSGRILTYTTNAAGRSVSAVETANSINYVTAATYAPQGALASLSSGTSLFGGLSYNNRLQPRQIYYGNVAPPTITDTTCPTSVGSIMHRVYNFNPGSDNGNVITMTDCQHTDRTQNFDYNSLNRIKDGDTTGSGTTATNWGEAYTIDAWGNLTNIGLYPGKHNSETLNAPANTLNQLAGFNYDAAGNLTQNGSTTYTYDAENRITATSGYSYVYDGNGQRVIKCSGTYPTCSSGTLYLRGNAPDAFAELTFAGGASQEYAFFDGKRVARRAGAGNFVYYYFADHLGSTGEITLASGTIDKTTVYYPYGGEISVNGPNFANNYKFTGKERDAESGLDMFGARYYGSSLGRFMTPDWAAKPTAVPYAMFGNPQSLNLYSYVNNNPTTTRDPDGHVAGVDDLVIGGIIVSAMAVAYLESPPGQQMLRNAASSITSLGSSISSFFHPDNSGQNTAPPPTLPTNVSQGTPGTTATNVATGTPASTSQQGAVDTSPVESRLFPQGVKDSTRQNAGGQCEYCSTQTVPGQKSQPGVSTPANQGQTDYYNPYSTSQDSSAGNG